MGWPSISIIVPSLNRGSTIEQSLQSILRQDYPGSIEVIVADGGSTDETPTILENYPDLFTWSRRDNNFSDAVNQGLALASGDMLAIFGASDFYLRDALRQSVEPFRNDPDLAIAAGCESTLHLDGRLECSPLCDSEITPRSLLMARDIARPCAVFRRAVVDQIGGLRARMGKIALTDFWYRALHFYRGVFVAAHTAVHMERADRARRNDDPLYMQLVRMVETCQADRAAGRSFRLSTSDKRDLYARWEILEEHGRGNVASSIELIDRLMESPECSAETISFLQSRGLIPKTGMLAERNRVEVTVMPDLNWFRPSERAVA